MTEGLGSRFLKPYHNCFALRLSFYWKMSIRGLCGSGSRSKFRKPHHNFIVLLLSSYSKILVRSLCGSGARFQVSEASSPFYCFVMKFLLRDVDSDMWLRVYIPGF